MTTFPFGPVEVSRGRMPGQSGRASCSKEQTMGLADKARNKAQNLGGKVKEALGNATGDPVARDEGRGDQAKANLKGAGEKIKDAFKK